MVRLFSTTASPNRGRNTQGDEVGRHRHGNEVQREVQHRRPSRAGDEVSHALPRVLAGEQPLPQHVEPGRPHAEQRPADAGQRHGGPGQVHGPDEQAPAAHIGHADGLHHEMARLGGEEVGARGAREEGGREGQRLGAEEPQHHIGGLEGQRQKREHAAPHAGRVDGEEEPVAQRGHVRPQKPQDRAQVHGAHPLPLVVSTVPFRGAQYTVRRAFPSWLSGKRVIE